MNDFIRKNSVNKFYISIPNCHSGNEIKMKGSGLYSSLFLIKFSLVFQKKIGGGGGVQKRANGANEMMIHYNGPIYRASIATENTFTSSIAQNCEILIANPICSTHFLVKKAWNEISTQEKIQFC